MIDEIEETRQEAPYVIHEHPIDEPLSADQSPTEELVNEGIMGPNRVTSILQELNPSGLNINGKKIPNKQLEDLTSVVTAALHEPYAYVQTYFDPQEGTSRLEFHNSNPADRHGEPFLTINATLHPSEYASHQRRSVDLIPQRGETVEVFPPRLLSPQEIINILDSQSEPGRPIYVAVDNDKPLTIGTKSQKNPHTERLRNEIIPKRGAVTQTRFELDSEGRLVCVLELYHNKEEAKNGDSPYMRIEAQASNRYQVANIELNEEDEDEIDEPIETAQQIIAVQYPAVSPDKQNAIDFTKSIESQTNLYRRRITEIVHHNLSLNPNADFDSQITKADNLIIQIQTDLTQAIEQFRNPQIDSISVPAHNATRREKEKHQKAVQKKEQEAKQEAIDKINRILGTNFQSSDHYTQQYLTTGLLGNKLDVNITQLRPQIAQEVFVGIAKNAKKDILSMELLDDEVNALLAYFENQGVKFQNPQKRLRAAEIIYDQLVLTIGDNKLASRQGIVTVEGLAKKAQNAREKAESISTEHVIAQQQIKDITELLRLLSSNSEVFNLLNSKINPLQNIVNILQSDSGLIALSDATEQIDTAFSQLKKTLSSSTLNIGNIRDNDTFKRVMAYENLDALKKYYGVNVDDGDAAIQAIGQDTLKEKGVSLKDFRTEWRTYIRTLREIRTLDEEALKRQHNQKKNEIIKNFEAEYDRDLIYINLRNRNRTNPDTEFAQQIQGALDAIQAQIFEENLLVYQKNWLGREQRQKTQTTFTEIQQKADPMVVAFYEIIAARLRKVDEVYDKAAQAIASNATTSSNFNPDSFKNEETFGAWYPPKPKKEEKKAKAEKSSKEPKNEYIPDPRIRDLFEKLGLESHLQNFGDLDPKVKTKILNILDQNFKKGQRINRSLAMIYLEQEISAEQMHTAVEYLDELNLYDNK